MQGVGLECVTCVGNFNTKHDCIYIIVGYRRDHGETAIICYRGHNQCYRAERNQKNIKLSCIWKKSGRSSSSLPLVW
jgi:hypothetical protein